MENEKLVSIIIPVYNVEQYLRKCLNTVISQTYMNLEIILINDGSTDSSPDICREYAGKDSRIILINQENGGLSAARNAGIAISHGEYIGFVDSDDYVYLDMYEHLVKALEHKKADIAECLAEEVTQDQETAVKNQGSYYYEMTGEEALYRLMSHKKGIRPRYAVWNKLFRREFIEDLRFPNGEIHEDYFYDALAFLRTEKYIIVESKLYCHRNRPYSITAVPFNEKDYDKVKHIEERTKYLWENGFKELAKVSQRDGYETLLDYFYRAFEANLHQECLRIKKLLFEKREDIYACGFKNIRNLEFRLFYFNSDIYIVYKRIKNRLYAG